MVSGVTELAAQVRQARVLLERALTPSACPGSGRASPASRPPLNLRVLAVCDQVDRLVIDAYWLAAHLRVGPQQRTYWIAPSYEATLGLCTWLAEAVPAGHQYQDVAAQVVAALRTAMRHCESILGTSATLQSEYCPRCGRSTLWRAGLSSRCINCDRVEQVA